MELDFLSSIIKGDNNPPCGKIVFDSSDHVRFQNGQNVSGHNYNCHRRITIEKNIEGAEGYTVTMYNMDGMHPLWQNNIQMSPKRMKIVNKQENIIEFRGYGLVIMIEDNSIVRAQLNMFDRHVSIVYLK